MSNVCIPILAGVASLVSEIKLAFKFSQNSLLDHGSYLLRVGIMTCTYVSPPSGIHVCMCSVYDNPANMLCLVVELVVIKMCLF